MKKPKRLVRRQLKPADPTLRFTPYAWAKLQWFCHRGTLGEQTEIGGFGIADSDDLLLIRDFVTIKQKCTMVTVHFDDQAVAEFFDDQVDEGRRPDQFARIWLHTHPGSCPDPSGTDEETFQRVFGQCDWAVMFILSEEGKTFARMRFNIGPGGSCDLPVSLDCSKSFPAADIEAWEAEYQSHITHDHSLLGINSVLESSDFDLDDEQWIAEIEAMGLDPEEFEQEVTP